MNEDHVHQVYYGDEGDDATRVLTRTRIHWTVDLVPEGRVLDIGCSQGVASVLLAERGEKVVGVDNEMPAIEFAERVREKLDPEAQARLEFVEADAERLPFEPKSFDHAICSEVLEHVDDPERVVEEIFRVLRPGGTLVATVPFGVMPHPDHKRVFYPATLSALLEPLFSVQQEELLERHAAVVVKRRTRAKGKAKFELPSTESAFLEREQELHRELGETKEKLHEANLKYRNATAVATTNKDRATAGSEAAKEAREKARIAEEQVAALRARLEEDEQESGKLEAQLTESRARLAELDEMRERAAGFERSAAAAERELAGHEAVSSLLRESERRN